MRDVISANNGGAENGLGEVPSDLSTYDELTQTVLAPYTSGDNVRAIYVTIGGAGKKDGTSWSHAVPTNQLKSRLDDLSDDASAGKIYLLLIASSGDASYDTGDSGLRMQNHVAIVGGWDASGDWGRSGTTVLSGGGTHRVIYNFYSADNPLTNTALLYGVSLEDGKLVGDGNSVSNGGGIYNNNSSPVLTHVTIANNSTDFGAGIYNENSSSAVLTNVTIANNSARDQGGGIYNLHSSPVLTNVTIANNSASQLGGGILNNRSSPVLTNVTIANNSGASRGVGIYNYQSSPVIVNSILWGNTATSNDNSSQLYAEGGGIITLAYSLLQGGVADISLNPFSDGIVSFPAPTLVAAGISDGDPKLSDLTTDTGSLVATMAIGQDSSADDLGVYVRRSGNTYYYSTNESDWYTDFTSDTGLTGSATLPADSTNPVATDATGKARKDRPDAGAYEYISEAAAP